MRAQWNTLCAPLRADTMRTKSCGDWPACFTTSITNVTLTSGILFSVPKFSESADILRSLIRAILSHADYTGVVRESRLEHALFAADELCGFLVACALVRPDRSFDTLEPSSVKKRMKDKAFARTVNREDLWKGAEELGLSFDEHCAFLIAALREIQTELGLGARG